MSDFARNLFGFGRTHDQQPNGQMAGRDFPSQMIPHPASPTTALSNEPFAMGTTIRGENDGLSNLGNHQADGSHPAEQQRSLHSQHSRLTAELQTQRSRGATNLTTKDSEETLKSNDTDRATSDGSSSAGDGSAHSAHSAHSDEQHVRQANGHGKLRVTIERAVDLNVTSERAQPYVVCTFEGSEFVTGGPDSFDTKGLAVARRESSASNTPTTTSGVTIARAELHSRNPVWNDSSIFDVVDGRSAVEISVYDGAQEDFFLGHARIRPRTDRENKTEGWYRLRPRLDTEMVTGRVRVRFEYTKIASHHYIPQDFEILRLLGKGTFGRVFQVKKKDSNRVYAMKVLSKKVIVKKKEVAHTIGERDILVRTSTADSAFIVGLKFSFQTPTDLYLVTDFMSGGELFWHLQREGRFPEDRAKFYIAELVMALEHLHDNGIVYRDLKPENILLDANGHIALCDFGLSKANLTGNGTTNTFCGTTEYLAPEVLLDESGYTKMVDFWSLGVLIFEMCCGWSPFYADNTQQMYKNIAFGKVRFPKEVLSPEGRSFVKGLLNRNPKHRLGAIGDARELRAHPFFRDIDWKLLCEKKIPPPFIPHISNELDTSNFDPEFTNASTSAFNRQLMMGSTPLPVAMQEKFKGFTYVDDSTMFDHLSQLSVKKGNSLKPQYGSLIPGDPNLPPDEEVIESDSEDDSFQAHDGATNDGDEDMDIDSDEDQFVNGPFDM